MPQIPPTIQSPALRIMLSHFLNQIQSHHSRTPSQCPIALHWDSRTKSLQAFAWPCDSSTGDRILPGQLEAHRRSHEFKTPSCLCAFLDQAEYSETHIGVAEGIRSAGLARSGSVLRGEYVAVCAKNRCGYFLCLENFYPLEGIKVNYYKRRASPLPPQNLIKVFDIEKYHNNGVGLVQVVPDMILRGNVTDLQSLDAEEVRANQANDLFSDFIEGVSEDKFWLTFVQCLQCRAIFLRRYYAISHKGICPRTRATAATEPYAHGQGRPRRKARDRTALRALLTPAFPADVPEDFPMASLPTRFNREPSPTPTLKDINEEDPDETGESHGDAVDLTSEGSESVELTGGEE